MSRWDWELLNSRIWLTEVDFDRDLDFSHLEHLHFAVKKLQTKIQNVWLFSSTNIYLWKCQLPWWDGTADENRRSQAKCHLVQTSLVCVGVSWPRSCLQTSLYSVCTHKILSYRSPAQLIKVKCPPPAIKLCAKVMVHWYIKNCISGWSPQFITPGVFTFKEFQPVLKLQLFQVSRILLWWHYKFPELESKHPIFSWQMQNLIGNAISLFFL